MSDLPPPAQPYRSALLVHGLLACAIVLVAWFSDGDIVRAVVVAVVYFVLATAWTWFRFRQREKASAKSRESRGGDGREGS